MKKKIQASSCRKKSGRRVPRQRLKPVCKGLDGLARSFTNVGIPPVIETEISTTSGISARLFGYGNIPARSGYGLKIKL